MLWPSLVAFDAPLCAFVGCFGWHSSAAAWDYLPIILDENGPSCLLTRGVMGGDVEQLLHGIRLITTELVH
jgi:hypothetical protein